jgi:arsenate reductase
MNVTIYHNPRCSKSRQALDLLEQHGVQPEIALYLETPPSVPQLTELLQRLKLHPKQILRFGEDRAEALGLTEQDERSEVEWIKLLADNPILIERPIVVTATGAAVCRPPEKVLELLADARGQI